MELSLSQTAETKPKTGGKKSWQEMRHLVRTIRKQLSNVSTKNPTSFAFRDKMQDGVMSTRIYFLSTLGDGRETTLLYIDIIHSEKELSDTQKVYQWEPLLESTFQVLHPVGRLSREEQLQRERKRLVMWGINSYDYHGVRGRFVFTACGSVFYCDDAADKVPPFFPQEIKSSHSGARLNPQMCPSCPDLIGYIYNSDLWLYNVVTNCEIRLTFAKKGAETLADDPLSAGLPSYVTQEEFNRYSGFWWQPCLPQGSGIYHILYEEVDESDVEILHLPSFSDDKSIEDYRFPRAGTSNSHSTLKMIQFTVNPAGQIEDMTTLQLAESLQSLCPDYEYLVRVGWTPDGKFVWAQVLDRAQSHLNLVLIPLYQFVPADHMQDLAPNHISDCPVMQIIFSETSSVWINVNDVLHFFPQKKLDELTFLWASEESGFRHLYLITVRLLTEQSPEYVRNDSLDRPEGKIGDRVIEKIMLTSGDWEVSEKDVFVDEGHNLVYFISLKDTPLESHLYAIALDQPGVIHQLTPLGFSHIVAVDMQLYCTLFVSIQSNITQPPFGQVYWIERKGGSIKAHPMGYILEPTVVEPEIHHPEIFSYCLSSGPLIYGMVFKPLKMETGKKYPTVLIVYGGPEVQLVTNTFKGMRHLRHHLLAAEGYVVVAADCRGSRHRGVSFESHIKERMGTVEVADQVETLQWLAENTGYIDMKRTAIHGWSYGGYLSLMGLAQRPDIFKLAVAGAPVTSWSLYDTGYTERYMGTPQTNPHGYLTGAVISHVNKFPNEENRLLIIHGLMDENVHFTHTSQLVSALVKAGKPYNLQVYPAERHSLRSLDSSEHCEVTFLSFLQQHL